MATPGAISEEICVSARSSGAALEAALHYQADAAIAPFRAALVDARLTGQPNPSPGALAPDALVRYIAPAPTREVLQLRAASALDPGDGRRGWVVVEGVTALGRSDVPLHLTVLVDVSESMASAPMAALSALQDAHPRPISRLELARTALRELVDRLPARTEISLLAFSRTRGAVVLPPTPAEDKDKIARALRRVGEGSLGVGLVAPNSAQAPLRLAYDMAGATLDGCADRRVLIVTDDHARFDVDPDVTAEQVAGWAQKGIELWTLSLGTRGQPTPEVDALTAAGRGVVVRADTLSEAVEPLTAALRATGTVGREPQVTVTFGPAVERWRRVDGTTGTGSHRWAVPERIDAGFRRVELYEVMLAAPVDLAQVAVTSEPLAQVRWSLQSPVPSEWSLDRTEVAGVAPLSGAPAFVRERVFAWTLGSALRDPRTDWAALARWAEPLVQSDGPARELMGWLGLLQGAAVR